MKPERAVMIGVGIIAAMELGRWGFSRPVRREIKERVRQKHGKLCSELSGVEDSHLECSHIWHGKDYQYYNHPDNGRLVTPYEHLAQHIIEEGKNGLSVEENLQAIESLTDRVIDYYGLDFCDEVMQNLEGIYEGSWIPSRLTKR